MFTFTDLSYGPLKLNILVFILLDLDRLDVLKVWLNDHFTELPMLYLVK